MQCRSAKWATRYSVQRAPVPSALCPVVEWCSNAGGHGRGAPPDSVRAAQARQPPGCGGRLVGPSCPTSTRHAGCLRAQCTGMALSCGLDAAGPFSAFQLHSKPAAMCRFSSGYAQAARAEEGENGHASFDWISGTDNLINDYYAKNKDSGSTGTTVRLPCCSVSCYERFVGWAGS